MLVDQKIVFKNFEKVNFYLFSLGQFHGYSPIVSGLYLSEIVRRVDPKGRNVSDYFKEEIAGPFGNFICWKFNKMQGTERWWQYFVEI